MIEKRKGGRRRKKTCGAIVKRGHNGRTPSGLRESGGEREGRALAETSLLEEGKGLGLSGRASASGNGGSARGVSSRGKEKKGTRERELLACDGGTPQEE